MNDPDEIRPSAPDQSLWQPLAVTLRTGKELNLACVTEKQLAVLVPDVMDPAQMQFMHIPALQDEISAAQFLSHNLADATVSFNWLLLIESRVAGWVSLFRFEHDMCELGYFVRTAESEQGLATAAALRVSAYAHDTLGIRRLNASTDPRNGASIRVLASCGFSHEGTQRGNFLYGETWQDTALFGRLKDDSFRAAVAGEGT